MGLRRWRLEVTALAALASFVVACHRQPRPTYEYGETETYTSTADGEGAPERVVESDATAAPAASSAASEPPAAREPDPRPAAEEPAAAPGRWYKAKPW